MHIAIEGMDGSGKTSQAKAISKRLNGEFIAKSFHEMNDTSGRYDSFVTIDEFTDGMLPGVYGMRQNFFWSKTSDQIVVTDRFYISNYWSRANDLSVDYFKEILWNWGIPDLMIILYADANVLYNRIFKRNPNDKDLCKPQLATKAYNLMYEFSKKMGFTVLVIDNTHLEFDETTDIIEYAIKNGIHNCKEKYCETCKIIEPNKKVIENDTGRFVLIEKELVSCENKGQSVSIPDEVHGIREKAFSKCSGEIKIEIASGVKKISKYAFAGVDVMEFCVNKNNNTFSSEGGMLFDKTKRTLIKCPNITSEVLVLDVSSISSCAFQGCSQLRSVTIGEKLEKIGYGAFGFCNNLEKIKINSIKVKFIAPGCFYGCMKLKDIYINSAKYTTEDDYLLEDRQKILFYFGSDDRGLTFRISSIKYLCPYSFESRIHVRHLYIDVEKVGAFAFYNSSIETLTISNSIKDIGEKAFYKSKIEKVYLETENSKAVPDVWNNSFDEKTSIIVPYDCYSAYINNLDWKKMNVWGQTGLKTGNLSCGNACLSYIAEMVDISKCILSERNSIWVFELASVLLKEYKMNVKLYYYNSLLMKDYNNGKIDDLFYPITCMKEYEALGGKIFERKMNNDDIKEIISENRFVVMCLDSKVLFRDEKLDRHSHYVIGHSIREDGICVITPGKEEYNLIYLPFETLFKAFENSGQWLIVSD